MSRDVIAYAVLAVGGLLMWRFNRALYRAMMTTVCQAEYVNARGKTYRCTRGRGHPVALPCSSSDDPEAHGP